MARLSLPTAQTQTATPTPTPTPTPPTPGSPAVVGAPTTSSPTLPIAEVGIRAADMTADVQTPTAPVAPVAQTETPAQEAVKITIESTESPTHIAQALQAELSMARAAQQMAQQVAQQTAQALAQLRSDVTAIAAKLREAMETLPLELAKIRGLADSVSIDNGVLRQDVETALSNINDALASRGFAADVVKPKLTLHRVRRLLKPATVDGDAVVIYYNPRQAGDGGMVQDDVEVRLKPDVVRNVHIGYKLEVPAGYVCDVSYGSDVVASYRGRGEQELVLPLRARPAFGALLSAGQELCRLTLRKAAALDLVLVE